MDNYNSKKTKTTVLGAILVFVGGVVSGVLAP